MKTLFPLLLLVPLAGHKPEVVVHAHIHPAGQCTLFTPQGLNVCFTKTRPDNPTPGVYLVVPAGYTDMSKPVESDRGAVRKTSIHGFVMVNGVVVQESGLNDEPVGKQLDGAAIFMKSGIDKSYGQDTVDIQRTNRGRTLQDKDTREMSVLRKFSIFQQHLLVYDGKAESFIKQTPFPRRALAVFYNGKKAGQQAAHEAMILECAKPMQLSEFAKALVEVGAKDAVNLDMGAWDEGWYRDFNNEVVELGFDKSRTDLQTNWITFQEHPCNSPPP